MYVPKYESRVLVKWIDIRAVFIFFPCFAGRFKLFKTCQKIIAVLFAFQFLGERWCTSERRLCMFSSCDNILVCMIHAGHIKASERSPEAHTAK